MDAVARFASLAEQLCDRIEEHSEHEPLSWLLGLAPLVAEVHALAMNLPTYPEADSLPDGPETSSLRGSLTVFLGDLDTYRLVFDPYELEDSTVYGSLSDDLADIYGDVCGGLSLYRASQREAACDWWRSSMESHWGWHAIGFLRAAHFLRTRAC